MAIGHPSMSCNSMAKEYGRKGTAILMTGMGDDGVEGLGSVQAAGGITMAQSPIVAWWTACPGPQSNVVTPAASFHLRVYPESYKHSAATKLLVSRRVGGRRFFRRDRPGIFEIEKERVMTEFAPLTQSSNPRFAFLSWTTPSLHARACADGRRLRRGGCRRSR